MTLLLVAVVFGGVAFMYVKVRRSRKAAQGGAR